MIVVSMTSCPPKLRGDLSKWLLEISTGVYVGRVSARVREALWARICENIGPGRAVMVFSSNNEQHLDFHVHNTDWQPVDLDGIRLMKHPLNAAHPDGELPAEGFSRAARQRLGQKRRRNRLPSSYVLLDLETTGLSPTIGEILEIGLIDISAGREAQRRSFLIRVDKIPPEIEALTGISTQLTEAEGVSLKTALEQTFALIDDRNVVIYNAEFDLSFLRSGAEKCGLDFPEIQVLDLLTLARDRLRSAPDHKLETVAHHLGLTSPQTHRALPDCALMQEVLTKLNENPPQQDLKRRK